MLIDNQFYLRIIYTIYITFILFFRTLMELYSDTF